MSAPNFAQTNTDVLYCIFSQDEWEHEVTVCDASSALREKGWERTDEYDGGRYYCGHYFAKKSVTIPLHESEFQITIKAKTVSGYYEGGTFDFDIFLNFYPYDWRIDIDYYEEQITPENCIADDWYSNAGLSKIHAHHICDKIERIIQGMKDEAQEVFKKCCDRKLVCGGIFSNGEAIYYDADSERGRLKAAVP